MDYISKIILIQNVETCYCVMSQIVFPPRSVGNSYQLLGIHQTKSLMLRLPCNYTTITNPSFYVNLPKTIAQN